MRKRLALFFTLTAGLATLFPPAGDALVRGASKTVTFSAGKLIEIVYLDVKPGTAAQVEEDFNPQIEGLIRQYGGKVLAHFKTEDILAGELRASHISLIEWPDIDMPGQLVEDSGYKRIKPIRDGATTAISFGFYAVPQDTEVTFYTDRTYEFAAGWWTDNTPEVVETKLMPQLQEYFAKVGPLIGKHGGKSLVNLGPHPQRPDESWVYGPDLGVIFEWPTTYAQSKLFEEAEYQQYKHLRDEVIPRIDMIHARIQL